MDAAQVVHELRSSEHAARTRCFARGSRDGKIGSRKADRAAALADLKRTLDLFPAERAKLARTEVPTPDLGDPELTRLARFTDALELRRYQNFMHLVPRIVNVVRGARRRTRATAPARPRATAPAPAQVSLGEATPEPGTGTTLPLDLRKVASRLTNAYYAPRRFAAVQLSFATPRARVLLFHTGRLVGTGALATAR
jgi:hypothetical protein